MKTTLSLGITLQLGERWLRIDLSHEVETPQHDAAHRALVRDQLYGELQPALQHLATTAQRLGRMPTPDELRAMNTNPAEMNADPAEMNTNPAEMNTNPAEMNADPADEDSWTGRRCDSCNAPVVWLHTASSRPMPVHPQRQNGTPVQEHDIFDPRVHRSHFASCPFAAHHRFARVRPWLLSIERLAEDGTRADLEVLRRDLNAQLTPEKRTKAEGAALRRALKQAEAAIAARHAHQSDGLPQADPVPELTLELDPEAYDDR